MTKLQTLFATTAFIVAVSSSAHAGFEWKGPMSAPVKQAPATSLPAQSGAAQDDLAPVIMWDGQTSSSGDMSMPAEKVGEVEKTAVMSPVMTSPDTPVDMSTPVVAQSVADDGAEVSGFGSDLPLVIALQQVVPAGYQFSFASGVNPGALMSWEGGKSWKKVLSDMLAAQGLGYKLDGNIVVVGYFKNAEAAPVRVPIKTSSEAMPWSAPAAEKMHDDMSLQNDATMQTTPAMSSEPVTIHRQKPSSLMKKETAKEPDLTQPPIAQEAAQPSAPVALAAPVATPVENVAPAAGKPLSIIETPQSTPQATVPDWAGAKGQTLRDVLKSWADVAGVELYWSIDYDYRLSEDVAYPGTFDEAVGKLLDRFATIRPQPYGQLHQNGDSPRVLVVKSYDLTE